MAQIEEQSSGEQSPPHGEQSAPPKGPADEQTSAPSEQQDKRIQECTGAPQLDADTDCNNRAARGTLDDDGQVRGWRSVVTSASSSTMSSNADGFGERPQQGAKKGGRLRRATRAILLFRRAATTTSNAGAPESPDDEQTRAQRAHSETAARGHRPSMGRVHQLAASFSSFWRQNAQQDRNSSEGSLASGWPQQQESKGNGHRWRGLVSSASSHLVLAAGGQECGSNGDQKNQNVPKMNALKLPIVCLIKSLDGQLMREIFVHRYELGQYLVDNLKVSLDIKDAKYFGLKMASSLEDQENVKQPWLDLNESVYKQINKWGFANIGNQNKSNNTSNTNNHHPTFPVSSDINLKSVDFYLRIKYYPPNLARVQDPFLRQYLFLQLRRDLRLGKLTSSMNNLTQLMACILQYELGDFRQELVSERLNELSILPNQDMIEQQALLIWEKRLKGLRKHQVQMQFLRASVILETYGFDYYPVRDHQRQRGYLLGFNYAGIKTIRNGRIVHHFRWHSISKISYERRMIIFHIYPTENSKRKQILGFKCLSNEECHNLYMRLLEQKYFFTVDLAYFDKSVRRPSYLSDSTVASNCLDEWQTVTGDQQDPQDQHQQQQTHQEHPRAKESGRPSESQSSASMHRAASTEPVGTSSSNGAHYGFYDEAASRQEEAGSSFETQDSSCGMGSGHVGSDHRSSGPSRSEMMMMNNSASLDSFNSQPGRSSSQQNSCHSMFGLDSRQAPGRSTIPNLATANELTDQCPDCNRSPQLEQGPALAGTYAQFRQSVCPNSQSSVDPHDKQSLNCRRANGEVDGRGARPTDTFPLDDHGGLGPSPMAVCGASDIPQCCVDDSFGAVGLVQQGMNLNLDPSQRSVGRHRASLQRQRSTWSSGPGQTGSGGTFDSLDLSTFPFEPSQQTVGAANRPDSSGALCAQIAEWLEWLFIQPVIRAGLWQANIHQQTGATVSDTSMSQLQQGGHSTAGPSGTHSSQAIWRTRNLFSHLFRFCLLIVMLNLLVRLSDLVSSSLIELMTFVRRGETSSAPTHTMHPRCTWSHPGPSAAHTNCLPAE